jgi:O-antigen ligase
MSSAPPSPAHADTPAPRPAAWPQAGFGSILHLLTAAWTAGGIVLWLVFPMTAPFLLPLTLVAPLAWYWSRHPWLRLHVPSAVTAALALAGLYLLANASWSLSPPSAYLTVGFYLVVVGVLHVALNTLPDLDAAPLRAMAVGALAGLAIGGALVCVEIWSEQALRRLAMRLVPQLVPRALHVIETDGAGALRLMPYLPNTSVGALALAFWPAVLIASRLGLAQRRVHRWGLLAAFAVVGVTVLASEHATSKVALAGAAGVFALYLVRPLLARRLVVAGWVAATLLVVPIVWSVWSAGAHRAAWLPDSARHRVVIWGFTSEQVVNAPLLGTGIGTARVLHEALGPAAPRAPGTKFRLETSMHSHNAYLQVWYETGAAGAAILLGLGLLVLRALRASPAAVQPHLAAAFVAGAILIALSFSIWAPWIMASLAMAGILAGLGTALGSTRS